MDLNYETKYIYIVVTTYLHCFTIVDRLPIIRGGSGVQLKYRMEFYDQIGKVKVDACQMIDRKSLLDSLHLTDDHVLHSDLYFIGKRL